MVDRSRKDRGNSLIYGKMASSAHCTKKGAQDDPANYRPVCLISHTRKVIEGAILPIVIERSTHMREKFGFQVGISVQNAILKVQHNAEQGLHHTAVLDLEKAYDKVDKQKLLQALAQ